MGYWNSAKKSDIKKLKFSKILPYVKSQTLHYLSPVHIFTKILVLTQLRKKLHYFTIGSFPN